MSVLNTYKYVYLHENYIIGHIKLNFIVRYFGNYKMHE
jgi:hypothetical protein